MLGLIPLVPITYSPKKINTNGFKVILQDFIKGLIDIHKARFYHGEAELYYFVVSSGRGYLASAAKLAEDESDLEMHKKGDVRTFALSLLQCKEHKQMSLGLDYLISYL